MSTTIDDASPEDVSAGTAGTQVSTASPEAESSPLEKPEPNESSSTETSTDAVSGLLGRARLIPWLVALSVLPFYLLVSINRYERMQTMSPDLAIFEQAVQQYSKFKAPIVDTKSPGYNLLGDHFHPLLALMGPFYRVFPTPVTLLTLQALLVALSIVPVTRAAGRRLGPGAAVALGLAYGWSWGIQSAIDFDFHELCMAVPIIAFSLEALIDRKYLRAALISLLLLGVKEEFTMTIAALGVVLFLRKRRRLGVVIAIVGLFSFWLIVWKIIPHFNPQGEFDYTYAMEGTEPRPLWQLPLEFVWPRTKLLTVGYVLAITGFIAVRSPISLLAVPTLAWRFHSEEKYWGLGWQYNAVLMPIIFMASIEVIEMWRSSPHPNLRRYALHIPAVALAVAAALTPSQPFGRIATDDFWTYGPQVPGARAVMSLIPDGASVQANVGIHPKLVQRTHMYFPGEPMDPTDFIILDSDWDSLDQAEAIEWVENTYPEADYRVIYSDARWTLFKLYQ